MIRVVARLLLRCVIVQFVQEATGRRFEWTVINTGRPTRVGRRRERLSAVPGSVVADDKVARNQVDLLPVIVHEGRGRPSARQEAEQPRPAAGLPFFVEIAGENLLLNVGRVTWRTCPSGIEIEAMKLEMRFSVHGRLPS